MFCSRLLSFFRSRKTLGVSPYAKLVKYSQTEGTENLEVINSDIPLFLTRMRQLFFRSFDKLLK